MFLKQSTAVTIKMGPCVDPGDADTVEDGLTIQKADVRLSKNGGDTAAASADQGASDAGAPHDEGGDYDISLDTDDTDTLGKLRVRIHVAGALPVWQDFMVLPANVYDSLVGGSDNLQVDATQISGDQTAADTLQLFAEALDQSTGQLDSGSLANGTLTAAAIADDAITAAKFDESTAFPLASADSGSTAVARTGADGDTLETLSDEIATVDGNVDAIKTKTDSLTFTVSNKVDSNITAINGNTAGVAGFDSATQCIVEGTVGSGSTTTSIVTSALSPAATVADQFKGRIVIFKEDTTTVALRGQATDITANTSGGVLTCTALTTAPASGDTFVIQ